MKKDKEFKKQLKEKTAGMTTFNPNIFSAIQSLPPEDIKKFCESLAKNTFKVEKMVMEEIFKEGILTKEEYEKDYQHKYVDERLGYKINSFPELMQSVLFNRRNPNEPPIVFVSTNEKILEDKKKLSKRFKIKIMNPKEALKLLKKEDEKELKEICIAG